MGLWTSYLFVVVKGIIIIIIIIKTFGLDIMPLKKVHIVVVSGQWNKLLKA